MTFGVYPLRLHFEAGRALQVREGTAANLLRGQFGKILQREYPDAYRRYFAPVQEEGPSGYRDLPRPFVFRMAELEGARLAPGDPFVIGVNLFEMRQPPIDLFTNVLGRVARESFGSTGLDRVEGAERRELSLLPAAQEVKRVLVEFKTPTELKGVSDPRFGDLYSRIRDRVSLLRSLYGGGPLEIDFRSMGDRARAIRMTRCEIRKVSSARYSRTQGTAHSLGGFIGVAEYQGDLTEFLPYLEVARWTGVGRQTVWGKGEIQVGQVPDLP